MSDSPSRPRPWPRVMAAGLAVVAVAIAIALLAREDPANAERDDALESWSQDLDSWAAATIERLGPQATPGAAGHDLSALFDIAWTQPVRYPDEPAGAEWADADRINAACTATTTYIQSVQDAVQPPAPPADLDSDHVQGHQPAERFTTYQRALVALQAEAQEQGPVVRAFCGTYPALVAAHADAAGARVSLDEALVCDEGGCTAVPDAAEASDAADSTTATDSPDPQEAEEAEEAPLAQLAKAAVVGPNERIHASLATQCYLGKVQSACTADAAEARALAEALGSWAGGLPSDPGQAPGAEEDLAQARTIVDDAAAHFTDATADLGGDRAGVEEAALKALQQVNSALDSGAQDLATTLDPLGAD